MADTTKVADAPQKTRKPQVRKPVELAVVVRVTDESGNAIPDAKVEVLTATKDVSGAFKLFKQTPGSDMITYTIQPGKTQADAQKA